MNKLKSILLLLYFSATIFIILSQLGCCTLGETRCAGNTVQSCDSLGVWYNVVDCNNIDPNWQCCWTDEINKCSCLPENECK